MTQQAYDRIIVLYQELIDLQLNLDPEGIKLTSIINDMKEVMKDLTLKERLELMTFLGTLS